MEISRKIKEQRMLARLTQDQVAKQLNLSRALISNWETGQNEPTLDSIRKLCVVFDCTADELLEIETKEQRDKIKIFKDGCEQF